MGFKGLFSFGQSCWRQVPSCTVCVRTTLQQFKFFVHTAIQTQQISELLKRGFRHPCFQAVVYSLTFLTIDELETLMWETGKVIDGAKEIIFETRVNGKAVLGNGRATMASPSGKAKLWFWIYRFGSAQFHILGVHWSPNFIRAHMETKEFEISLKVVKLSLMTIEARNIIPKYTNTAEL